MTIAVDLGRKATKQTISMRMQIFRVMKLSCKILKTVFHLRCNTTVVVAASIVWQLVVYLSFVVYQSP